MDKPGWKKIEIGGITEAGSSAKFKTGDWRSKFPIHLKEKCTNCMLCVVYCPDDCILVKDGILEKVDYDYCKGCGICFKVCPVGAIKMDDETKFEEFKLNPKKFEQVEPPQAPPETAPQDKPEQKQEVEGAEVKKEKEDSKTKKAKKGKK